MWGGAPGSSAASDGSMPGGGESPSTCFSRANLGARGRLHSMTHSLLTDCSCSAWRKNQLFFTRHEARASDAVYAKTFWFRKKEKLPLQKNTKKQNKTKTQATGKFLRAQGKLCEATFPACVAEAQEPTQPCPQMAVPKQTDGRWGEWVPGWAQYRHSAPAERGTRALALASVLQKA